MALTRYELETIINFNEAEPTANIFTTSSTMKKKLEKLGTVTEVHGGWELDVPKGWITIKPPKQISEKQRASAIRALAKARAKKP